MKLEVEWMMKLEIEWMMKLEVEWMMGLEIEWMMGLEVEWMRLLLWGLLCRVRIIRCRRYLIRLVRRRMKIVIGSRTRLLGCMICCSMIFLMNSLMVRR